MCTLSCWSTTSAQTFVDISQIANIDVHASGYNGTGITVVDFNQDGLDDIVCCDPDSTVFLFANNGEGSFTPKPFLENLLGARMASFVDLDNDGDLDGRVVLRANGILNGELSVDVSVLRTGFYSLEIRTASQRHHTTLILK